MTGSERSVPPIRSLWMVSREYDGLAGAGGVKDVSRQLAEALVRTGVRVTVVLPRYGFMDAPSLGFSPLIVRDERCRDRFHSVLEVDMNYADQERRERVSFWEQVMQGVRILLVEAQRFAEKGGVYAYTEEDEERHPWQKKGSGHYDYFAMNILLQKAALEGMILLAEQPDVVHCQDGHAATLPPMMRELAGYRTWFRRSGALVTIHNAGAGYHQDVADLAFAAAVTGLPDSVIRAALLDNSFDPFMAAAPYAVMNTVSENYARELQESSEDARTGWLGHRLRRRGVRLAGITNGINPEAFDPRHPRVLGLAAAFEPGRGRLDGKKKCKAELLARVAANGSWTRVVQHGTLHPDPDLPLLTFIGRLTGQKGVDILLAALPLVLEEGRDFQVLILGSGDPVLEESLYRQVHSEPFAGRFCFLQGYDPELAPQVYAAGDFFLIPSLFEPCGLTDYMAQLLGNLPIVHAVGGLVKVEDGVTGFSYREHAPAALARAVSRALDIYEREPERMIRMIREGVARIRARYTWEKVVGRYIRLYEEARAMTCSGGDHADA